MPKQGQQCPNHTDCKRNDRMNTVKEGEHNKKREKKYRQCWNRNLCVIEDRPRPLRKWIITQKRLTLWLTRCMESFWVAWSDNYFRSLESNRKIDHHPFSIIAGHRWRGVEFNKWAYTQFDDLHQQQIDNFMFLFLIPHTLESIWNDFKCTRKCSFRWMGKEYFWKPIENGSFVVERKEKTTSQTCCWLRRNSKNDEFIFVVLFRLCMTFVVYCLTICYYSNCIFICLPCVRDGLSVSFGSGCVHTVNVSCAFENSETDGWAMDADWFGYKSRNQNSKETNQFIRLYYT